MRNLLTTLRRSLNRKNLVLNYTAEQLDEKSIDNLKDLLQSGTETGTLSNHQRGWNNKYINIIIISDKEILPELIEKIKRL